MTHTASPPTVGRSDPEGDCDHAAVAFLGRGGRARYYRCASCGACLIELDDCIWLLRPRARAAA